MNSPPQSTSASAVWHAAPWLIAFHEGRLYACQLPDEASRHQADQRLAGNQPPPVVLGRGALELPMSRVLAGRYVDIQGISRRIVAPPESQFYSRRYFVDPESLEAVQPSPPRGPASAPAKP